MRTYCSILFLAAIVSLVAVDPSPTAAAYQTGRGVATAGHTPHRMIVLTDIEADPDDTQSLVRLVLYSNVIELQGLVATTSTHKRTSVRHST